jgi:acyl dehydratase
MPLDYNKLMAAPPIETTHELTVRDTILYALGVGVGVDDPTDAGDLQYVYEEGLKALPTMAVVLTYPGFWQKQPEYGMTWQKILHGEQSIEIHKAPLPVTGKFRGVTKIDEIYDKGADKGAIMLHSRRVYNEAGEHIATTRQSSFLRGDGGFGGKADGAPKPHASPERAPDVKAHASSPKNQALLYRLSGDYNPIHVDPKVAKQAGFDRPILHGLGTYGAVGRALVRALCEDQPERLRRMDVRFSSPVYPGETFEIDIWHEAAGKAAFRVRVAERDVVVLQNGYMEYGDG